MENILSHVADSLGIDRDIVQELNLLSDGDAMAYDVELKGCNVRRCWKTIKEKCQYEKQKKEVNDYNR